MANRRFLSAVVASVGILIVGSIAGCITLGPTTQKVTLKNGETYTIQTFRDLPLGFQNDQIKVRDLGVTAMMSTSSSAESPPYVWYLSAELKARGHFTVTVRTPLDKTASTTLDASGPGTISLHFFPKADYPTVWEGIDQPGTHFFPFQFVFEENETKTRFEFTQWAKYDERDWKEMRDQIEWAMQRIRN